MSYLKNKINDVNPEMPSVELGPWIRNGDNVVLDTVLPQFFKFLHIGTGGDVMVQGQDGEVIPFKGILDGEWIPVIGNSVLSTTAKGDTTALNITFHGGN